MNGAVKTVIQSASVKRDSREGPSYKPQAASCKQRTCTRTTVRDSLRMQSGQFRIILN